MFEKNIVHSVGMHSKPEFYKGRGAIANDLDGAKLVEIHRKIKEELGEEAANAFTLMVQNVKLLSAQKFLKSLYALEENDWVYSEEIQESINAEKEDFGKLSAIYEYHMNRRNDTNYIRNSFLLHLSGKYDLNFLRYASYHRSARGYVDDFFGDYDDYDDDDNAEYE